MDKFADAFSLIRNGANIKQGLDDSGYPITRIETISNRTVDRDKMGYAGITDITKYSDYVLQDGDILMSHINSETHLGKAARYEKYEEETIIHGMNLLCLRPNKNLVDSRYAFYYLSSEAFLHQIPRITKKSVNQASFNVAALKELTFPISSMEVQQLVADILDKANELIALRKEQLAKLDELIKARFVELFGDLKSNSKGWPIVAFTECAKIDTNMIHDFNGYEDYPHIGIDSIEKETGRLSGYRTVAEDGIVSGKYLFTEKHIIYSKIRPNLNKVAMPDFVGVCSADAYPILVKDDVCVKEYLVYTMRSKYFLDYILSFSSRTNLPKVNKRQVEGFSLPLPAIELQQQFATFVAEVNKSKVAVQKALDEAQLLFDSLMQKYFG